MDTHTHNELKRLHAELLLRQKSANARLNKRRGLIRHVVAHQLGIRAWRAVTSVHMLCQSSKWFWGAVAGLCRMLLGSSLPAAQDFEPAAGH